jgi:hypothetical protein
VPHRHHLAYPYLGDTIHPVEAVIQRSRTHGIDLVMVNGQVILQGGQFTRVNKQALLEELAASLRAPLTPAELRRRELAREVVPVSNAIALQFTLHPADWAALDVYPCHHGFLID